MANPRAIEQVKDTILVLDDEPAFLDWLEDFAESIGFKVLFVTNIRDALNEISEKQYRAFIVDLNVPPTSEFEAEVSAKGPVYKEYVGLFAAEKARNLGYRARQVIVYSVHGEQIVQDEANKLNISYITKGRPHVFKEELQEVLSYDPSDD